MLVTLAGKSHIDSTVPWFLNHRLNILIPKSCCSDGGPCANCEGGTWKSAQGSAECTECVAGKYSTTLAAIDLSTCLDCPTNSNSSAKSDSILKCTCNPGATGPDGTACALCSAGTYKSTQGSMECTKCPFDTYSTGQFANLFLVEHSFVVQPCDCIRIVLALHPSTLGVWTPKKSSSVREVWGTSLSGLLHPFPEIPALTGIFFVVYDSHWTDIGCDMPGVCRPYYIPQGKQCRHAMRL
jgi:hypothetical protein